MNKKQIERFFKILDRQLDVEARIILTGAAAGTFWGQNRASIDVDFALELKKTNPALWEHVEKSVAQTVRLTGIQANFSQDIDRWGMIGLLDYKRRGILYAKYGRLILYLMDPVYWSIGEMTTLRGSGCAGHDSGF